MKNKNKTYLKCIAFLLSPYMYPVIICLILWSLIKYKVLNYQVQIEDIVWVSAMIWGVLYPIYKCIISTETYKDIIKYIWEFLRPMLVGYIILGICYNIFLTKSEIFQQLPYDRVAIEKKVEYENFSITVALEKHITDKEIKNKKNIKTKLEYNVLKFIFENADKFSASKEFKKSFIDFLKKNEIEFDDVSITFEIEYH